MCLVGGAGWGLEQAYTAPLRGRRYPSTDPATSRKSRLASSLARTFSLSTLTGLQEPTSVPLLHRGCDATDLTCTTTICSSPASVQAVLLAVP